jgi:peptidoglycan/xylan/chitin deacetylase (PgdA/CDA1 family)
MDNRFFYIFAKIKIPLLKGKEKAIVPKTTPSSKAAYLTFDDGPSSNTAAVLDVLNQYNVKATFFVIGNDTQTGRSMYKRINKTSKKYIY